MILVTFRSKTFSLHYKYYNNKGILKSTWSTFEESVSCVWNITFCRLHSHETWLEYSWELTDCCCKFRWKALQISPSPNTLWCTDSQGCAAIFARHYHLFSANGIFITRLYPLDENVILQARRAKSNCVSIENNADKYKTGTALQNCFCIWVPRPKYRNWSFGFSW